MSFLNSLEEILGIDDRPIVEFEVPEWNITVRLRAMTGTDRDGFENHVTKGGQEGTMNIVGMRAKMVAACLVDEDGNRLVTSAKDEQALGSKSAAALDRLFAKCMEMNGMSAEDEEKLKESFGETDSDS